MNQAEIVTVETQLAQLDRKNITYVLVDEMANVFIAAGETIKITNQSSYDTAIDVGKVLSLFEKGNNDHHDPFVKSAKNTHNLALEARNRLGTPLKKVLIVLRSKVARYVQAQREKERQDQLRLEAEQKKRDEAAQLKEAERLEKVGADKETVDRALDVPAPAPSPPPVAASRVQEQKGASVRKNWKAKVIDPMKLIQAVWEGKANASLVVPDEKALNKLAKALEGNFDVPGCVAYNDATTSFSQNKP